jgi:hypothetical protein
MIQIWTECEMQGERDGGTERERERERETRMKRSCQVLERELASRIRASTWVFIRRLECTTPLRRC